MLTAMHHRLPISLALPCKVRLIFQRIFLIVYPLSLHLREGFSLSIKLVVVFAQFSSVTQLCLTLCDPMDCNTLGFPCPSPTPEACSKLCSSSQLMPSNHLILCCVLLLPLIFPSIRVFPNESLLHIRWPEYWSFSFSISPSNEYSGPISFRID